MASSITTASARAVAILPTSPVTVSASPVLGGADRMGNVLFTGYYSPVLEVRHRPDAKYKYPIYAMPIISFNKNYKPSPP